MALIDGVVCLTMDAVTQTRATFRSSRLSAVRLWAVITLQTVQMGDKYRS